MAVWRLIPLLQADGLTHMAIDEWLFQQHCQGYHPPVLRFCLWSPVAISLGRHQQQWPNHWNHLFWQGKPIQLVRRPTGGRAVLHQGDLTYTVIASGWGSNRTQAYQEICTFLIQGWQALGVELTYGQAGRGYIHNPNCFGLATGADLTLPDGTKLIGSAQLRQGERILQQGSIRLKTDPTLLHEVFGDQTLVTPLLPFDFPWEILIKKVTTALLSAAETCFQVNFEVQPLSTQEWQSIHSFQATKP